MTANTRDGIISSPNTRDSTPVRPVGAFTKSSGGQNSSSDLLAGAFLGGVQFILELLGAYRAIWNRYPPSLVTGRSISGGQIFTLVTGQLFRKYQNYHNSYWKIWANFLEFLTIFEQKYVKKQLKIAKFHSSY